jgi:hypothetical protein
MLIIEMFFITAGIALLGLAFWFGKEVEEQEVAQGTPVPSTASINHALQLQNSLNELLHELQSLSQEITDDLEAKLDQLKDLLRIADTKCEELQSAESGHGGRAAAAVPRPTRNERFAPQASGLDLTIEDEAPAQGNRYQQIYQLADDGCSLDEIARHVRMGKGEVQLILSLRKKD